jgi:hypothetical protein
MRLRSRISGKPGRLALPLAFACATAGVAHAQQLIGYVNTRDADVTGVSDTLNGQAVLTGSASITAREHTAPITLGRGGTVRVCQTSAVHITESRSSDLAGPLLFSLDRGAMEIQMAGTLKDSIMTPDLRFTVASAGPLDLRLRVARNGDTCVENRGSAAPTLAISDPFGETMYQLSAGQHVLFEHGNLHEVVDKESSPCGCPDEKGMSLADALLASGGPANSAPKSVAPPAVAPAALIVPAAVPPAPTAVPSAGPAAQSAAPAAPPAAAPAPVPDVQVQLQSAEQTAAQAAVRAAEQHPFPAAISEGLAPAPVAAPPAPASPGQPHTMVTDTLSYNAPAPEGPASAAAPADKNASAAAAGQAAAPPAAPPVRHDVFHVVGRFFKRMFGG